MFSFGRNANGQLGDGTFDSSTIATPIDTSNLGGLVVKQVAAGSAHSLLIAVPEPSGLALGSLTVAGLVLLGSARHRK